MPRTFIASALAMLGLVVGLVAATSSGAVGLGIHVETAKSGSWLARFSYVEHRSGIPSYTNLHLTLRHGSALVLDAPVRSTQQSGLGPGGFSNKSSIAFTDLDADGSPELILDLYTGGAHCCFLSQIFNLSLSPPTKLEHDWGDSGYALMRINGRTLFRTNDDAFAYVFTDYADSAFPIKLLRYDGRKLTDVTRMYPSRIASDAKSLWQGSVRDRNQHGDVRGVLAAWAADESLLGRDSFARRNLLDLAKAGVLDQGVGGAKGDAYVRALWKFLARTGYVR